MISPDLNINNAPDYIRPFVESIKSDGPAELLLDGSWCGHGEELFRIYDIIENSNSVFQLQFPVLESDDLFPPGVKVYSAITKKSFLIYDTKRHPASLYSISDYANKESKFSDIYCCGKCNETNFKISIGFEVPEDSESANDITWFTLATECVHCGDKTISFDDETA